MSSHASLKDLRQLAKWIIERFDFELCAEDSQVKEAMALLGIPEKSQWCKAGHAQAIFGYFQGRSFVIAGYHWPNNPKEDGYAMCSFDSNKVSEYAKGDPKKLFKIAVSAVLMLGMDPDIVFGEYPLTTCNVWGSLCA